MNDHNYGLWMNQTINQPKPKNVAMAGFSHGRPIILKTWIQNEKNIKEEFYRPLPPSSMEIH
jgi:hypothetical protein